MSDYSIAELREHAETQGIPVCSQKECPYVGTHIAAWVTGDIVSCKEHADAFPKLAVIMGVRNVTVRENPDAPQPRVPSKRFLAIAKELQREHE